MSIHDGWKPYQNKEVKPLTKRHRREHPERDLVHLPLMKICRGHPILGQGKCFLFHVENERRTQTFAQGNLRKAMGVKSGISDLILLYPSRGYHGLVMELKAPGKFPTELQQNFLDEMKKIGYCAIWMDDAKRAYDYLIWYLGEDSEK